MKKVLILICLVYYSNLNAQIEQLKVLYTIYYNIDRPVTQQGILYLTPDTNVFIYGKDGDKKKVNISQDDPTTINVLLKGTKRYVSQTQDSLISKISVVGDQFILREKMPDFNWQIQDSIKMIGNYTSRLATSHFRGRDYTAWFTEEIPVSAGPWKFNGLPGLIIDIADTTNQYHWVATAVSSDIPEKITLPDCKKCDTITIKDFEKFKFENSRYIKSLLSKLPRGSISTFPSSKPKGIEINFD